MDLAEKIHRALYNKSGRANANKDPDFLAGFAVGNGNEEDASLVIEREWKRRDQPVPDTAEYAAFTEWKRGFWASRLQYSCAQIKR